MAGKGRIPQVHHSRARDDHKLEEFESTGDVYGLPLPDDVLPDGETWHPQTLRMWDSLRRHELLRDEPDLGWQFLLDTALMHHAMWSKGRWEFAAELRLRVAKFGATPEDRLRLKVKIVPKGTPTKASKPESSSGVTSISSRRSRLTG